MDFAQIALILLAVVAGIVLVKVIERVKTPAAIAAVEKKVEDYTHAEAVKLVGALLDHLGDTSPAQAKIAAGQAEMAAQAQLLTAIKARVAAASLSAAV